ncbi:MAG: hypothetical protein WKF31_11745 [Thermoleophilaceae bacterium]
MLNLLFLALIALVPFTTDVLDRYGTEPAAPMLYALVLGAGRPGQLGDDRPCAPPRPGASGGPSGHASVRRAPEPASRRRSSSPPSRSP